MSKQLEELFFKMKLPKSRGDRTISEYLEYEKRHLISGLENIIKKNVSSLFRDEFYRKLEATIPMIEDQFNSILRILDNHEINKEVSMQYLDKLINNIDRSFHKKYLIYTSEDCFMRVRKGDDFELTHSELFHIPFTMKGNYGRYSTPDIHTLYLTNNNLNVAWYECKLPNIFAYASFYPTHELAIFRLNLCPYRFSFLKLKHTYLNKNKSDFDLHEVEQDVCNYLTFYPLLIACSLSVERDDKLPEEYFIPNLLIEWIQKNESIDGISYFSCSSYSISREHGINYAFPTKTNTKKYCEILSNKFLLSNPRLMEFQLDTAQDIAICTTALNDLTPFERYSSKIENFLLHCYTFKQSLQLMKKNNTVQLDHLQSILSSLCSIFEDYDLLSECIANELTEKTILEDLPYNCDEIVSIYQFHSNKIKKLSQRYHSLFDYFHCVSNTDDNWDKVVNEDVIV